MIFLKGQLRSAQDWQYQKFSDVVYINPRTKVSSKKVNYVPMEAVNIETGSIDFSEIRDLDENPSLPKFQQSDVLFARITPCTENGKVYIVENISDGIASSELTVLRPSNNVLPRYLFYFVQMHRIKQFAISQMMGTTGRQRVPDYVFKKDLHFEFPVIPEQQKFVAILSKVYELIQKIDQIIEQTRRLKKGLMQRLLTKGTGHTKFKKVRMGFRYMVEEYPEEWKIIRLQTFNISHNRNNTKQKSVTHVGNQNCYLSV